MLSSSRKNHKTSREYELLVQKMVKQEMSGVTGVKDLEIKHNTKIKGLSGYEHQIDVMYRFKIWGTEILILVECKQYGKKVGVDDLLEFRSRIEDIKAHKGIFVTTSGFQKGAVKFAKANRIALLVVRETSVIHEVFPFRGTASEKENSSLVKFELHCELASLRQISPEERCKSLVGQLNWAYNATNTGYDSRIAIDQKRNAIIIRHIRTRIALKPNELDFVLLGNISRKVSYIEELFSLDSDIITSHPNKLLKAIILDELLTPQNTAE
jgi:hypothetical protein